MWGVGLRYTPIFDTFCAQCSRYFNFSEESLWGGCSSIEIGMVACMMNLDLNIFVLSQNQNTSTHSAFLWTKMGQISGRIVISTSNFFKWKQSNFLLGGHSTVATNCPEGGHPKGIRALPYFLPSHFPLKMSPFHSIAPLFGEVHDQAISSIN